MATRTAIGEPCTLIVIGDASGLISSFHGGRLRTTAAPCPEELAELIEELRPQQVLGCSWASVTA